MPSVLPLVSSHLGLDHSVYRDIEKYVVDHQIMFMFEWVIQEMAYHRPVDWQPFLVAALERYRLAKAQKRLLTKPEHLRHKEHADFYCGTRSLRKMCRSILFLLMTETPEDPVQVVYECFQMPDDLYLLEKAGLLAKRHARFASNGQAYIRAFKQGLVLEPPQYQPIHKEMLYLWDQWHKEDGPYMTNAEFAQMVADIGGEYKDLKVADLDINADLKIDFEEYQLFMNQVLTKAESYDAYHYDLIKRIVKWDAVLAELAHEGRLKTPEDDMGEQLYKLFLLWDGDRDHQLNGDELKALVADCGFEYSKVAFDQDWGKGTTLGRKEFCLFFIDLWQGRERKQIAKCCQLLTDVRAHGGGAIVPLLHPDAITATLLELFDMWDANGSGLLEPDEVDEMLRDMGGVDAPGMGWAHHHIHRLNRRPDGCINRLVLVELLCTLWEDNLERTAGLALTALKKKVGGAALTSGVVANVIAPDELYTKLGALFDMWDADKNGFIGGSELAQVLRDIGMDSKQIMKVNPEQKLDREEFCEFLKIEWAGKELDTATVALEALEKRMASSDTVRTALEMAGELESTVAAVVKPQVVNERLSELFGLWDMDGTGCIELDELERLMIALGGEFEGMVKDGFPDELMAQVDLDKSGVLDQDEFVVFLKGLWQDKTVEQAEKMLIELKFRLLMVAERVHRIRKAYAARGETMDRAVLQEDLDCCPPGSWDSLELDPVPREGRAPLVLSVEEIMAAISKCLRQKPEAEAFSVVDHLEMKVLFGKNLLKAEPMEATLYKLFDHMDTDMSGRVEQDELQRMIDCTGHGGFAEGIMALTDDDGSDSLDKLEFVKMFSSFFAANKEQAEVDEMVGKMMNYAERKHVLESVATRKAQ